MTDVTDTSRTGFRPGMLLNDTRYRGLTLQFVALIFIIVAMAFLGMNLVRNLAAAGLNISYGFLNEPSGYDISQSLIPYTSRSTHLRASVVGLLNTLLVAFLACVTATILGVIAGVLRLSKNWLVSRLMAVYVEMFRNVPVLIWILVIGTLMTVVLPAPSAFRGDDPSASMLFGAVAFTNRGIYVPMPIIGQGFWLLVGVVIASVAATILYRRYAKRQLLDHGRLLPTVWPSLAILFAPAIVTFLVLAATVGNQRLDLIVPSGSDGATLEGYVEGAGRVTLCDVDGQTGSVGAKRALQDLGANFGTAPSPSYAAALEGLAAERCNLLAAGPAALADAPEGVEDTLTTLDATVRNGGPIALEKPYLAGFNFSDGIQVLGSLIALWFALAIYTGAFIAENVRSGILAVSRGQTEAAAALGLRPRRIMNLVVLPQALRVIVPPLISQYLNITKNSSLAIAVGYPDITATLGGITLNQTGRAIETVLLLMLFYLIVSLLISGVMNIYNSSVSMKER